MIAVLILQVISQSLAQCTYDCNLTTTMSVFLWISIPILLIAITVVWTGTRNPHKDLALAELPSPSTDSENYYRPAWSSANVADGIEDDSPEPEGQVMLV